MKKRIAVYLVFLLIWFSLNVAGLIVGDFILVKSSGLFSRDGLWWSAFFLIVLIYFLFDKIGEYLTAAFLLLWMTKEYLIHWHYVIFGVSGEELVRYKSSFQGTYQLIPDTGNIVFPDLYHMILHFLIITIFLLMSINSVKDRKKTYMGFAAYNEEEVEEVV